MSGRGQGGKLPTTERIVKGEGVAGAAMGEGWFPLPEGGGGEMEGEAGLSLIAVTVAADEGGFYYMCDGDGDGEISRGIPRAEWERLNGYSLCKSSVLSELSVFIHGGHNVPFQ